MWSDAKEVALGDVLQEESFTTSATSAQGSAITGSNKIQRYVRIFSDAKVWVTWGSDPTATTDGTAGRAMGSENPEYFKITAGEKIAAITRS